MKAPESYLDQRRPPLLEALKLEGDMPMKEALESLERKGYFTPPPRPWKLGAQNCGMGRISLAVLDRFGDLVVEVRDEETAQLIISAVNASSESR